MNKKQRQDNWTNYWKSNSTDSCRDGIKAELSELDNFWAETSAMIKENNRILDLCTGKGDVIKQLIKYQSSEDKKVLGHFTGVDLSDIDKTTVEDQFEKYKANVDFRYGINISELPFEAGVFDLITSQFGVEYALGGAVLKEVCRVMDQTGAARFAVHHKESALVTVAKEEIKHIDLLLAKDGYFDSVNTLIPIFSKLRNPANAKKINKDNNATRARERFNNESQKVVKQAENSSVPDLLQNSLRFSRHIFDLAKIKGRSVAKNEYSRYKNELNLSKERLLELITAAMDEADVKKLEEDMLTYGKQITKKEELKNDGKIVAWGIEIS